MLPNNKVSKTDKWLEDIKPPRDRSHSNARSFCLGGVAVGDNSQGITSHTWESWTDGTSIFLKREDKARPEKLLTDKGITDVSVTFDKSMNIIIAYQAGVLTKLWIGRNGSLSGDIKLTVRSGRNPRVALDDDRIAASSKSDVVLAYISDSYLCCRYQKEAYGVEHKLKVVEQKTELHRIGMGLDNRFLFLLKKEIVSTDP